MTERLFIFGLGFSGLEIARLAKAAGWSVAGTCTSAPKAERLRADGIEAHLFDGTAALPATAIDGASHVLCTIAPGTTGDPAPPFVACGAKRNPVMNSPYTTFAAAKAAFCIRGESECSTGWPSRKTLTARSRTGSRG